MSKRFLGNIITDSPTGDAVDFGDLVANTNAAGSCSNGHGGL